MIEVDSRILKAAKLFQSKNDVRCYLRGVYIETGRAIASNGHTAIICSSQFIKVEGKGIIIDIFGNIPVKAGMAYIQIVDPKTGLIRFKNNKTVLAFNILEGEFHNVDKVIPTEPAPADFITINPTYIERAIKANKILSYGGHGLKFTFYGDDKPVMAEIKSLEFKTKIIIMPMFGG
jgi:DNA polymerase III sliding clamp (beta) subunit (PCNA family)